MVCFGLSAINTILSLAVLFGFITIPKLRGKISKIHKDYPFIFWIGLFLILNGSIQIKMVCP